MIMLFAFLVTLGAILFHSFHMTLGAISLIALFVFFAISFYFRTRRAQFFALVMAAALFLGALTIWRVVAPAPALGNRAFLARVTSVSSSGDTETVILIDENGARYRATINQVVLPGDEVSVRGVVKLPEDFVTDNGRLFPYQAYLLSHGVSAVISYPTLQIISTGRWSIGRLFALVQQKLTNILSKYIAYPFDTVVSGMVLGVQGSISDEIKNLFRDTGTLHTLVLSGYNVTLLAGILGLLFRGLPIKIRTTLSVVGIIALVAISGAGVAALRAGIMGSLSLLAIVTRRTYDPLRALVIAYLLFFFLSPLQIFSDPGFHLSFIATAAIIILYPKIETKFLRAKTKFWRAFQSIVMLSTFMPLIMFPYFMYFSGTFAFSSPIANVVASLFVPLITIAGMILLASSFFTPFASFVGILIGFFVSSFLFILRIFSHISVWTTPEISWWMTLLCYITLGYVVFRSAIKEYARVLHSRFAPALTKKV